MQILPASYNRAENAEKATILGVAFKGSIYVAQIKLFCRGSALNPDTQDFE